jgi:hypothetical protein
MGRTHSSCHIQDSTIITHEGLTTLVHPNRGWTISSGTWNTLRVKWGLTSETLQRIYDSCITQRQLEKDHTFTPTRHPPDEQMDLTGWRSTWTPSNISDHSRSSRSHTLRYFGFCPKCSRSPVSVFSLSLYRHPSIYILCNSHFTSYNKQQQSRRHDSKSRDPRISPSQSWLQGRNPGVTRFGVMSSWLLLFIVRGKVRVTENIYRWVSV